MNLGTIKGISTTVKICVNLSKAVGPLFISQFDYAKFKYLDFKTKQAQMAGYTEYFQAEARALVELKTEQMRDSLNKKGLERLKCEENIRLITKEINRLLVYSKVPSHIRYLEQDKEQTSTESTESTESITINETWLDRFNSLASNLNEEWRQELLAKSFAIEAQKPGTIGLDTLFTVAQLDQRSFYFFDAILSASLKMYEVYILPTNINTSKTLLTINEEQHSLDNILYQLRHTGLLISDLGVGAHLNAEKITQFVYGSEVLAAQPASKIHVPGIVTSRSGSALAALCTTIPNDIGVNTFNLFEAYLIENNALHTRYTLSDK